MAVRELHDDDLRHNPLLRDLLEQAKARGEALVSYHGTAVALTPLMDLTDTFTFEEQQVFQESFHRAGNPANGLTFEQAMQRFREHGSRDG